MVANKIEQTSPLGKEGTSSHENLPSIRVTTYEVDDDLDYQDELTQTIVKKQADKMREMQSQFPNTRKTNRPTRRG